MYSFLYYCKNNHECPTFFSLLFFVFSLFLAEMSLKKGDSFIFTLSCSHISLKISYPYTLPCPWFLMYKGLNLQIWFFLKFSMSIRAKLICTLRLNLLGQIKLFGKTLVLGLDSIFVSSNCTTILMTVAFFAVVWGIRITLVKSLDFVKVGWTLLHEDCLGNSKHTFWGRISDDLCPK